MNKVWIINKLEEDGSVTKLTPKYKTRDKALNALRVILTPFIEDTVYEYDAGLCEDESYEDWFDREYWAQWREIAAHAEDDASIHGSDIYWIEQIEQIEQVNS